MGDRFLLVLAGGRGERFWPWSRPERPKQLLPLASGGRSLLRATLDRVAGVVPDDHVLVLTAATLVDAVRRECPAGVEVVGEPVPRNTAPAIAAAARVFAARAADASFAVLPSDHRVMDVDGFRRDLGRAFAVAERDPVLVTFGIPPRRPEAGLGYIRRGAPLGERLFRSAGYREKPDAETARAYLASGEYLWNSGMFVWGARVFLGALEATRPDLAEVARGLDPRPGPGVASAWREGFERMEAISVDYALMEEAPNVVLIEAGFDWDDVGSWQAWAAYQPRDARGNVLVGDALAVESSDCVVVGESGTAVALGLTRTVVVHADGATLSCPLEASESLRQVSDALRARGKP